MTSEFSSSSITNIAPALLKVQQALKPITKDAENPFLKNRYTSLSSVLETIRPILTENGLVLIQRGITGTPDMLSVESRLIHAPSGEWIRGVISMPMPLVRIENDEPTDESLRKKGRGMNTFQLYGSGLSYGKRYGLMSLLAISTTDEDTDGEFCLPEQTAIRRVAYRNGRHLHLTSRITLPICLPSTVCLTRRRRTPRDAGSSLPTVGLWKTRMLLRTMASAGTAPPGIGGSQQANKKDKRF